ncbi:MAG: hypothetical protein J6K89_03360 [Oscillospiraceae bacterium]|nr:hypothetical protein [Oscillospiraceae bacterium]
MKTTEFSIRFADLSLQLRSEVPIQIPDEFIPFLTEGEQPDACYTIEQLHSPVESDGEKLYSSSYLEAYKEDTGSLQIFRSMSHGPLYPACRLRTSGEQSLYVTPELREQMIKGFRIGGILDAEELLLWHDALMLHSSLVCHKGRAILFSGPSGIGKSTQASLWQQTFGAEIINGDRAVIRPTSNGFYAGGSPWCGSSGIYRPDFIPIQGIVLLRQGPENVMLPAPPKIAFQELYSQCVIHAWDETYVSRTCDLLLDLLGHIPVWTLSCVPQTSAAILAEPIVFYE